MRAIRLIVAFVNSLNKWTGYVIGGALILPVVLILCYEVVARYALNAPTIWAHDLSSYLFGAIFLLGGGYALRYGGHIRMDVLYSLFPPRTKAIVDLFTSTTFYLVCVLLIWKGAEAAWESLTSLERSMTVWAPPLWPVRLVIPVGGVLLICQGLVESIGNIYTAVTSRELATRESE